MTGEKLAQHFIEHEEMDLERTIADIAKRYLGGAGGGGGTVATSGGGGGTGGAVTSVNGKTGVVVLTTADINDSSNKRYVTDSELSVLSNTSGTNTGDQTSVTGNAGTATALQTGRTIDGQTFDGTANITVIAPGTHAALSKTTPVDADELSLVDSAASNVLKKLTWANLKATLKTYFDTIYQSALGYTAENVANKSTDGTFASNSDTLYPSQKAAKTYADTKYANTTTLDSITAPAGNLSMNSHKITSMTDPTSAQDAATKAYVDLVALGQDFKEACRVATTANLVGVYLSGVFTYTATGTNTIDGVTLALGDRVLVKNQTTTFQNGIYTVTTAGALGVAGILTRSPDANSSAEFKTGDSVFVTAGSTLATTTWAYNGADSPTIGADPITFVQVAGPGSYTAGNGISITGTSIAIDTSITVDKSTAQSLSNKKLGSLTSNGFVKTSGGDGTLSVDTTAYVPTTTTVNGHALSGNINVTASDLSLGNVANVDTTPGQLGLTIDGGGSAIATGIKGYLRIPFNCTITSVDLVADQSGSIVVDIWKQTYASFPPTVSQTITASALPTLSSAQKYQDATLTGWTKTLSKGDYLGFNVNSAAIVTRVHLALAVTRT